MSECSCSIGICDLLKVFSVWSHGVLLTLLVLASGDLTDA